MKRAQTSFSKLTKVFSALIAFVFSINTILPPTLVQAQAISQTFLNLPVPGTMVQLTPAFEPLTAKGIKVFEDNPLLFEFIIDQGDTDLQGAQLEKEMSQQIKYFLAALTTPEKDIWVNLSPYEQDRIIPDEFGQTEMGRDLLAQDYMLKQLTSSLMSPEEKLGKTFWNRVYKKAQEQFGTTDIPVNTFNKVWIVPEQAEVYSKDLHAYVTQNRLKVMMEEDYLAMAINEGRETVDDGRDLAKESIEKVQSQLSKVQGLSLDKEIMKDVILPEIEREVNEGEMFAKLRQIFSAVILAKWYKLHLQESLLGQIYVDQNKIAGVDIADQDAKMKIFNQYVEAFKKGVYDYIKEDYDPVTEEIHQRKYFSGGTEVTLTPGVNYQEYNLP
ncbi:MAG: hypothetical protein KC713_08435, partial [Candidatus Omnitrophica bacterium]|nr:hypothetical protein [Candidatus Omnitrophota bacterium]